MKLAHNHISVLLLAILLLLTSCTKFTTVRGIVVDHTQSVSFEGFEVALIQTELTVDLNQPPISSLIATTRVDANGKFYFIEDLISRSKYTYSVSMQAGEGFYGEAWRFDNGDNVTSSVDIAIGEANDVVLTQVARGFYRITVRNEYPEPLLFVMRSYSYRYSNADYYREIPSREEYQNDYYQGAPADKLYLEWTITGENLDTIVIDSIKINHNTEQDYHFTFP